MPDHNDIKNAVKHKYAAIAGAAKPRCGCCSDAPELIPIGERYEQTAGYVPEADLGLGCGLPTQFAGIRPGDTVVDLGSGAGNDVFIARRLAGETGTVIGIDMTEEMVRKAIASNRKIGYTNVTFKVGEIESLPLPAHFADTVISNCVINLVPDKKQAFAEIHRVLKKGGRFCISDLVTTGVLPGSVRNSVEQYAGCIAGALDRQVYLDLLIRAGFSDVRVRRELKVDPPAGCFSSAELAGWEHGAYGILSITVTGVK